MNKMMLFLVNKWFKLKPVRSYHIWREKRRLDKRKRDLEDDVVRAMQLLKRIDATMVAMRWSRQKRRQFWRDFARNGLFREDVFDKMMRTTD